MPTIAERQTNASKFSGMGGAQKPFVSPRFGPEKLIAKAEEHEEGGEFV